MQKTSDFSYNVNTRNKQEPCFDQLGGKPAQDTTACGCCQRFHCNDHRACIWH